MSTVEKLSNNQVKLTIEVSKEYNDVELTFMYVDNCAMQLVLNPRQFDVILTGNIFAQA